MDESPLFQQLRSPVSALGEIQRVQTEIQRTMLRRSHVLDAANFTQIHTGDLQQLFQLYDDLFFAGTCRRQLGAVPLSFRISRRMTSAGGKTTRLFRRGESRARSYEITVSSTLLFQTFHDVKRPIMVTGILCHSRLDALQRIFEHELVHLIEMLLWETSQCSQPRFQTIAATRFGHTEHRHELVTPRERAESQFGLRPGTRVWFQLDGRKYAGVVNRITRRATVLVEDPSGQLYSDGRTYSKFYVPFEMLHRIS